MDFFPLLAEALVIKLMLIFSAQKMTVFFFYKKTESNRQPMNK